MHQKPINILSGNSITESAKLWLTPAFRPPAPLISALRHNIYPMDNLGDQGTLVIGSNEQVSLGQGPCRLHCGDPRSSYYEADGERLNLSNAKACLSLGIAPKED